MGKGSPQVPQSHLSAPSISSTAQGPSHGSQSFAWPGLRLVSWLRIWSPRQRPHAPQSPLPPNSLAISTGCTQLPRHHANWGRVWATGSRGARQRPSGLVQQLLGELVERHAWGCLFHVGARPSALALTSTSWEGTRAVPAPAREQGRACRAPHRSPAAAWALSAG